MTDDYIVTTHDADGNLESIKFNKPAGASKVMITDIQMEGFCEAINTSIALRKDLQTVVGILKRMVIKDTIRVYTDMIALIEDNATESITAIEADTLQRLLAEGEQ